MWKLGVWALFGLAVGFLISGVTNLALVSRAQIQPLPGEIEITQSSSKSTDANFSYKPVSDFFLIQNQSDEAEQEVEEKQGVTLAGTETIETTELPVELVGTMAGAEAYSRAVFRSLDPRETFTLKPGESTENFKLLRVNNKSVKFLNRLENQKEKLTLNRSAQSGLKQKQSESEVEQVSRYRINQAIHSNMNNLLANVDATPELRGGRIIGFKLKGFEGKPGQLLKKLGFQKNDIITRVNGRKVNSMDRAFSLWSQLRNKKEFEIRVLRDGQKHELSYRLTR